MESKQRTPSVIARLMGLDELPPQQPVCKPHRVLSENYLRKSASIGLLEKRSYHESHSFRVPYEKGQEFINLFEVPGIPTIDKQCIQSIQEAKANASMTEVKMTFLRQKSTDANSVPMDEKHQHSQEFVDVVEELNSNKDLLASYIQQPDPFFTKHLCDLQFGQPHSQAGHVAVLKSSNAPSSRKDEISRKSKMTTARQNVLRSLQKLENGIFMDSCGDLGIDYTCFSPSRIVVLKPNLGKAQNAARSSFSPISEEGSQSSDRKHVEFSELKNGELNSEVLERKNLADNMEPSGHCFRVSRKYAKGISGQITHSISSSLREVARTKLRVDETSTNKSEVMMPSCPSFFERKNRCQITYSPSNRSSFAKQAKKQLSERWKMTKSLQEVRLASCSTTLGEMLAMPDQETRQGNFNCKLDKSGKNNQLSLNDGDANLGSPFGISSQDGWKEECARSLARTGSLAAACLAVEIPKSRTRSKAACNDCCLKLEEYITQRKNESRKQNCSQKDRPEARVSRSSNEKAQNFSCMDSGNNRIIQETCAVLDEVENKIEEEDFSEESCKLSKSSVPCSDLEYDQTVKGTQVIEDEMKNSSGENDNSGNCEGNSIFPNSSISSVASSSLNSEVAAVAETESVGMSSGTMEKQQSEPATCILFVKDGHSSHVVDASVGQESLLRYQEAAFIPSSCPRIDPEFPLSLGESYSPSPNSVLEPPFSEEILSGPECSQGVGADLHGLWTQLQLLKSQSEEMSSGPGMVVSSDEDSRDESVDRFEENRKLVGLFRAEESRDYSYLVDVLDEVGINGSNMQLGFETWYSPECPVSPSVFEMLEKKYGEQTSWEKSERRLLFDLINLGLKEILWPCMNVLTRAKPLRKRFNLWQNHKVIEEELWVFLGSQEKELSKDLSEKALGTEIRWLELWDDIDLIVSEIERFLFDELAAELVSIESF